MVGEKKENPAKTPTERIMDQVLPGVISRMVEKEKDYGPEGYQYLGSKGQFSDMSRKMLKLKRAVWDGQTMVGEDIDEMLDDIIAHALLMKLCRREGY